MNLTILNYLVLMGWGILAILWVSHNFSSIAPAKGRNFLATSIILISLLALFMSIVPLFDSDFLNLSLYAFLSHIIIIIAYSLTFPQRAKYVKRGQYSGLFYSMLLAMTAGSALAMPNGVEQTISFFQALLPI